MRSILRLAAGASLALLCLACASVPPHLSGTQIRQLSAANITIVYQDPRQPVFPLIGDEAGGPAKSAEYGGYFNGFSTQAIDRIASAENENSFVPKLNGYQAQAATLGLSEQYYQAVHATFSAIPWLHDAKWMRVPLGEAATDSKALAKQAGTDIVIFIRPRILMSYNVDTLLFTCFIQIDAVSPPGSYNTMLYGIRDLHVPAALGSAGEGDFNSELAPSAVSADLVDTRLASVFADGGVGLKQAIGEGLPAVQTALTLYFTGTTTP